MTEPQTSDQDAGLHSHGLDPRDPGHAQGLPPRWPAPGDPDFGLGLRYHEFERALDGRELEGPEPGVFGGGEWLSEITARAPDGSGINVVDEVHRWPELPAMLVERAAAVFRRAVVERDAEIAGNGMGC